MRDARNADREAQIAGLRTAGAEVEAEITRLNAIITAFHRHRFGARSEKLDDDQLKLALEELNAAINGVKARLKPPVSAPARTSTQG